MGNKIISYLKKYHIKSIFFKIFLLAFLLLVIPYTITFFMYTYYSGAMERQQSEINGRNEARRIAENFDSVMRSVDTQLNVLANDNQIIRLLTQKEDSFYNYDFRYFADFYSRNINSMFDLIDGIYIYSAKDNYIYSDKTGGTLDMFHDNAWYFEYKNSGRPYLLLERNFYNKAYNANMWYLTVIKSIDYYGEEIGVLAVNIDINNLLNFFFGAENDNKAAIFNEDKSVFISQNRNFFIENVLADNVVNEFGELRVDGETVYLTTEKSEYTGFNVIVAAQRPTGSGTDAAYSPMTVAVIVIFLLFSLILTVVFVKTSFKFLREFLEIFQKFNIMDRENNVDTSKNEYVYIIDNILNVLEENKKLNYQLEERLMSLQKAQYSALQAQINPHFLQNTLSNIYWMALEQKKDDNDVAEAVSALSQILQLALSDSSSLWTLKKELECIKWYVLIQRMRFGNDFDIKTEVDDGAENLLVIKMFIQPILENVFEHGLREDGEGKIIIRAKLSADDLILEVCDNGNGFEPDFIKKFNSMKVEEIDFNSKHRGMRNVKERIYLLFGEKYGVRIENRNGAKVTITIPQIHKK